jgi:arylsulfatase A-like enzyme
MAGGSSLFQLTDHLDRARIASATAPAGAPAERTWNFAEPRPEWRTFSALDGPRLAAVTRAALSDGVQVSLARAPGQGEPFLFGGLALDMDLGPLGDWSAVQVRARSRGRMAGIVAAYNLEEEGALPGLFDFFGRDDIAPVFNDGSVQVYSLPLRARRSSDSLRSLAILAGAPGPASFDILSATLVPRGAEFGGEPGVRPVVRAGTTLRTLFARAPARLTWRVDAPAGARLDLALTALAGEAVTYRVLAAGGAGAALLEETVDDDASWRQRSIDLSASAGRIVELTLEASPSRAGAMALWGAPSLSGAPRAQRPNVILYVIDGGGADLMSLYGYNRRTTPFLERLAAEGVVFERAFSNSTWTQSSTASFMTSLQHSVLGGLRRGIHSTPVPKNAVTMAEHMRRGGYQTAVFTSNPNAARAIGLERGVDVVRDVETAHHSTSSADLHELYWHFRADHPGSPTWVHFQTTDVHEPNEPVAPFAGLFVDAETPRRLAEWEGKLWMAAEQFFGTTSIADFYERALALGGVDRHAYYEARRGLYDETMAYQDHQLGRFVERLKAEGEWENTLLVVTADHGHPAGTFARFGRGLFEPQPEPWQGALFDSYATRVPLLFVWPGHIPGGRRIAQPVSLIDLVPTLLDLVDLSAPEVAQGRSLATALRGGTLEARPVILDEFRVDEATGELVGNLEIVDGRWGASLEIGPVPPGADPTRGRHAVPAGGRWGAVHPFFADAPRLLLYDLWNDPFALHAVNEEQPELVERYRERLLEQWAAQRALAGRFSEAGDVALSPEQLHQLQALGYVR